MKALNRTIKMAVQVKELYKNYSAVQFSVKAQNISWLGKCGQLPKLTIISENFPFVFA